jgi:hypothetical protein
MGKEVSGKRLSTEDGFDGVVNYITLDKVMYEVVKELRETIRTLREKIDAQEA